MLNRAFGETSEAEERAADPLAGGFMGKGHQCGMLWGAALAAGAEAFRREADRERAAGLAIAAGKRLVASFTARTGSTDCRDVTGTDFQSKLQMLRYVIFRAWRCFRLADRWAPEAIEAASEGLAAPPDVPPAPAASCASEVARRRGATGEQAVMVAGFAGGLGLSGGGCGALGAAIWLDTLAWAARQPAPPRSFFENPSAARTLQVFQDATDSRMTCREITGRRFETAEEHTAFVRSGGCAELIEALARPG